MKDVTLRQFILTGASLSVNIYWFCCISLYKNDNKLLLHPRKKQRHTKYLPIVYKHRRSNQEQTGLLTAHKTQNILGSTTSLTNYLKLEHLTLMFKFSGLFQHQLVAFLGTQPVSNNLELVRHQVSQKGAIICSHLQQFLLAQRRVPDFTPPHPKGNGDAAHFTWRWCHRALSQVLPVERQRQSLSRPTVEREHSCNVPGELFSQCRRFFTDYNLLSKYQPVMIRCVVYKVTNFRKRQLLGKITPYSNFRHLVCRKCQKILHVSEWRTTHPPFLHSPSKFI